MKATVSSAHLL